MITTLFIIFTKSWKEKYLWNSSELDGYWMCRTTKREWKVE